MVLRTAARSELSGITSVPPQSSWGWTRHGPPVWMSPDLHRLCPAGARVEVVAQGLFSPPVSGFGAGVALTGVGCVVAVRAGCVVGVEVHDEGLCGGQRGGERGTTSAHAHVRTPHPGSARVGEPVPRGQGLRLGQVPVAPRGASGGMGIGPLGWIDRPSLGLPARARGLVQPDPVGPRHDPYRDRAAVMSIENINQVSLPLSSRC